MTQQAFITPDVLSWARNRAQLTIEALSSKVPTTVKRLVEWEEGNEYPTFKQAQQLAKILHIPFAYLFLNEPPRERELPIPDLRTIKNGTPYEFSLDFYDTVQEAIRKQQWYKEYALENDYQTLNYIGKYTESNPVEQVALDIRNTLGWQSGFASEANVKDDYIKEISDKAERAGILVMRSSIVGNNTHRALKVNEFRGFAISDNIAPLIFINTADAKNAQIFTLAHELVHLWIGQSGISSLDLYEGDNNHIEQYCNKVAAELLAPRNEFIKVWKPNGDIYYNCETVAKQFHISIFVVIRRAYDLKLISRELFLDLYAHAEEVFQDLLRTQKKSGGGTYLANVKVWNGNRFSKTVVTSALEGKLLYRDAASLLNIKPAKIKEYAQNLGVQ